MMKWMLAAGAAALAIATPSLAERGQGGGKGQKDHSAHSMKSAKGGKTANAKGGDRANRGQKARGGDVRVARRQDHRGHGGQAKAGRADDNPGRGHGGKADHRGNDHVRVARVEDNRGRGRGRDHDVNVVRVDRGRDVRVARFDDDDHIRFVPRWGVNGFHRGFADGCPPGLAKKGNGCLPPGQAKKLVGMPLTTVVGVRPLVGPYRSWYRDDDDFYYRWDDDYIYRVRRNGGLIDALFPYANRDYYYYPMGAAYPSYFNYYNVPYQYQSYYPDGGDYWYRYGDGAIYMVDPGTQMISGIAALLTGAPLAVGQPLPPAYSVYNVPMAYRPTYYDTADNWYRYNDGYIYRVDPATQLITAVISAIV